MLKIRKLDLSFDDENILKNLNFGCKAGEITVITGHSGCGKSTLLKAINGVIPEYLDANINGEIKYNSLDLLSKNIFERSCIISNVFQNPKSQFYCMNSTEELAFQLENRNTDKSEIINRIKKYSKLLNIEYLLDKNIFDLSGGEKQMIALAACAISENDIILLDEPSSSLDNESIERLKEALVKLKELNKIIIVVEHRLFYLKDIMDRLCIIDNESLISYEKEDLNDYNLKAIAEGYGLRTFNKIEKSDLEINKYYKVNLLDDKNNFSNGDLSCHNFKKKYEKYKIFDFSISFNKGVNFIIGKNGIGKSTFIKLLTGITKGHGDVFVNQKKVTKQNKEIFMVMQDPSSQLFTENVLSEVSTVSEDTSLNEKMLEKMGLLSKLEKHPQSLSGGEKQRLLIAIARLSNKPIIILDEPTSGLCKPQMNTLINFLHDMEREGKIIIIITHDYEFIKNCGGNIYEFSK